MYISSQKLTLYSSPGATSRLFISSKTIKQIYILKLHITDYALDINQVTGKTENMKLKYTKSIWNYNTLKRQMFVWNMCLITSPNYSNVLH